MVSILIQPLIFDTKYVLYRGVRPNNKLKLSFQSISRAWCNIQIPARRSKRFSSYLVPKPPPFNYANDSSRSRGPFCKSSTSHQPTRDISMTSKWPQVKYSKIVIELIPLDQWISSLTKLFPRQTPKTLVEFLTVVILQAGAKSTNLKGKGKYGNHRKVNITKRSK